MGVYLKFKSAYDCFFPEIKIILTAVFLLIFCTVVPGEAFELTKNEQAWLDSQGRITVGVTENWPPFSYQNRNNTLRGFDIEVINILNRKLGGPLKTVIGPWPDLLEKSKQGRVDMLMNIRPTREREAFYHFTRPYTSVPYAIVAQIDGPEFINLEDLAGKSVALEKGFFMTQYIKKASSIKIIEVKNTQGALRAVQHNKADAYIGNKIVSDYFIEKNAMTDLGVHSLLSGVFASNAIAVKKDFTPLVPILNRALGSITHRETRLALDRWQSTIKKDPASLFSREEKQWIKSHPTILVGAETDWPPFDFVENGKAVGYSNDYVRLLAKKAGLRVRFLHGVSWETLVQMFKNNELHLLPAASATPDRKRFALFSESYYQNYTGIFVHRDTKDIASLEDLENKKLSAIKGYSTNEMLMHKYPGISLVYYGSPLEAMIAVGEKETDAYLDYTNIGNYLRQKHLMPDVKLGGIAKNFGDDNLHLMIAKDHPQLLSILEKVKSFVTSEEKIELQKQWLVQDSNIPGQTLMTSSEKEWISGLAPLRLGVGKNWEPFVFQDEKKNLKGVISEYIQIIKTQLGLKIEVIPIEWSTLLKEIEAGKIDMVPGLSPTPERRRFLSFSHSYFHAPMVIITRTDTPFIPRLNKLEGGFVGVVKGFAVEKLLSRDFPNLSLKGYESIGQAFEDLEKGSLLAVVANTAVFSYYQQYLDMKSTLKVNNSTPYEDEFAFGLRHELNPLIPIINRTLAGITTKEKDLILDKWVGVKIRKTIDWTLVFYGLGAGILFVGLVLLWNMKLSVEIRKRKQSETRFKHIVGAMADWTWEIDKKGKYTFCTKKVERILGYKVEQMIGKSFFDFIALDERKRVQGEFNKCVAQKRPIRDLENWNLSRDGHNVCLLTNGVPVFDEQNRFNGYRGVNRDITERKQNEGILEFVFWMSQHMDELSFEDICRNSTDKVVEITGSQYGFLALVDEEKDQVRFIYINDQAMGENQIDLNLIPEHISIYSGLWADSIKNQTIFIDNDYSERFSLENRHPKGHITLSRLMMIPIKESGTVVALVGVANKPADYTQIDSNAIETLTHHIWSNLNRKQWEKNLRESESRISLAADSGNLGMWEWHLGTGNFFVTDKWLEITGLSRKEYLSRYSPLTLERFMKYIHPGEREDLQSATEQYLSGTAESIDTAYRFDSPGKGIIWLSLIGKVVERDGSGAPVRMVGFQQDITAEKESKAALVQSRLQLQSIVDSMTAAVFVKDLSFRYILVNTFWEEHVGISRDLAVGNTAQGLIPEVSRKLDQENLEMVLSSLKPLTKEERFQTIRGERVFLTNYYPLFDANKEPYAVCGVATDITSSRKDAERIKKYADTQAILLQEVNHRVKNNLTTIMGMLHIEEDRALNNENRIKIDSLKGLGSRVEGLLTVHSLLSASAWEPLELTILCKQVVSQCLGGFSQGEFNFKVDQSTLMVTSDTAHHLTLILNELATNTIKHGVKDKTGLRVSISFEVKEKQVCLTYADNGPGFPENVLSGEVSEHSIGVEMTNSIVQGNMQGQIKRCNQGGAVTQIYFPLSK